MVPPGRNTTSFLPEGRMKIAITGVGAMGPVYAGILAEAGNQV